ncbi:pyridoxal phosphate-dependent decarboxylase family protein [Microbulbifer litoralis]|uniref:pyridoxal phosphate-dependent decarboxylase family protein n=1 Tax=Microbulbifer litoralis TaxID=2933965 RepID=UPI00202816FD|nr:pyridoxal-dependent decarboxylase [Microbulbifer sp. GX H0434]
MSSLREKGTPLPRLLARVLETGCEFLDTLDSRPVACTAAPPMPAGDLPQSGCGEIDALALFRRRIMPYLSASAGPRYWGFVTGGASPAALAGDWLAAVADQNPASSGDSIAPAVELQVLDWLRQLFGLPASFTGSLTSGATSANLLGLLCGRQFAGLAQGIDVAAGGMAGVHIEVLAASPHASSLKGLAMAGLGRDRVVKVACEADSERMQVADLERHLAASDSPGKIVLASAGTVTGTDFDDLAAIAALCRAHHAWLHVDAAFGLFAALLQERRQWLRGIELADSITSDAHKWLNVPYDSGIFLTRHVALLEAVLAVPSPYLPADGPLPHFMNRGVENSRRFRALPLWFALQAYGRDGVAGVVEDNCRQASRLAEWLDASPDYRLLAPCRLNVVVFRPERHAGVDVWLQKLNATGEVFMTPGRWRGEAAVRAAFSNWSTGDADVQRVIELLREAGRPDWGRPPGC